jgi:16S rRNA processing protein RimM
MPASSPPPLRGKPAAAGGREPSGKPSDTGAAAITRSDRVLLGEIGPAQGLKGEVRIRSYTEEPAAIARYGVLEDEHGRLIEIESLRVTPKALIARIKGVTTREGAEALARTRLYVSRDRLPARNHEEWYHADLIGLAAIGQNGEMIGTVVAIQNFGAGDLIEVKPSSGGATVLVPFTRDTVPEVDVEGGRLTLAPPEGLFE